LPVHVDAEVAAQGLQITIVDRGVGMSDEELSRVGTPYFRAAAAQGKRGIGLGFLLARKIVTIHGGTLHITSTPAKGTTVDIRLGPTSSAGLNVRG
jgi:signal transduction histidine kinase